TCAVDTAADTVDDIERYSPVDLLRVQHAVGHHEELIDVGNDHVEVEAGEAVLLLRWLACVLEQVASRRTGVSRQLFGWETAECDLKTTSSHVVARDALRPEGADRTFTEDVVPIRVPVTRHTPVRPNLRPLCAVWTVIGAVGHAIAV